MNAAERTESDRIHDLGDFFRQEIAPVHKAAGAAKVAEELSRRGMKEAAAVAMQVGADLLGGDEEAPRAFAKQQVEQLMREAIASPAFADDDERRRAFIFTLQTRLCLDDMLLERFLGHPVFSQQFEGAEAQEIAQHTLVVAGRDDRQLFEFALYSKVGDELTTGGGAAPRCTLRRVA